MRYTGIILFLLFSIGSCLAQTKTRSLVDQLDALLFDSQYDEVIKLVDQTKSIDVSQDIIVKNKKAEALIRLGKFDEAEVLLTETLSKINQQKDSNTLKAITQTNLGFLYLNQGKNDLALETLTTSSSALQQNGNSLETAQALVYLGQVYLNTGKYTQAVDQQLMALSIRQEKLPETHELIAASYNDLGLIYSRIDVDKALDNYEKATVMYGKLHGKEHPKFAIANTNMGVIYLGMELYGDAINYFETALKILEKNYPQPHPSKAFVLRYLGETHVDMKDTKVAMEYYQKALHMYIASQGNKHPDVAYMYTLIGNILKSENKFDDALVNYQQSLIANVTDFNATDLLSNPKGRNFYNGNTLLYSLMHKAQALEARHLGKTLKLVDLTLGLTTLQVCDTLIDRLRQQTTNETDKIALGAIANEVYADGVRIAYLLSDVSFRNRKKYREQSFYFAEKSKSAVLQEAISDTHAKSFANIPDNLLEEEKNLKASMALVTQKLAQKPSEIEEKNLRQTAFNLNQKYSAFTSQLEKNFPEYFNLKFNSVSPSISQLQNILSENTALISYFIDEKENRLYIYLITKNKFSITDKSLPASYDKFISGYRNSLYFMEDKSYIMTAGDLSSILIPANISSSVNNLIVLPFGRMSVIPFESLFSKKVKDINTPFSELPYLIKKFSIQYEFSAGLLVQKNKTASSSAIVSAKLLAPISFPEKDNLNDLPGTEREVFDIDALFKSKNINCEVLTKSQANELAVKDKGLKDYSLLHFATHGIVDEANPELSRIFLQNDSKTEDGNLFSGEIYNLQLNAELVTLSACQTGLGKLSKGEGVIGLSRALTYAGARRIVVSFWSVADESTAVLMTEFYKNILKSKDQNFSESLRQAKLHLINSKDYATPFYWSPFVLIGN